MPFRPCYSRVDLLLHPDLWGFCVCSEIARNRPLKAYGSGFGAASSGPRTTQDRQLQPCGCYRNLSADDPEAPPPCGVKDLLASAIGQLEAELTEYLRAPCSVADWHHPAGTRRTPAEIPALLPHLDRHRGPHPDAGPGHLPLGRQPSTVMVCSSCSDAKSSRPPASGIHNWTP